MTWFIPIAVMYDEQSGATQRGIESFGWRSAGNEGLGSAQVAGQWAWANHSPQRPSVQGNGAAVPRRLPAPAGARLRAPVELLSQMAEAARAQGRSESEVWVEAAREWLTPRESAPAAPPAAPATVARPRRVARAWDDIDALLVELRAPAPAHDCEGAPAA